MLEHEGGPLLVIGASGTGKTAVLRERFARSIEGGADPERVALVVRTRRDRAAARAWVLARLSSSLPDLRITTLHGLAHHVVGRRLLALGYEAFPEIVDGATQLAVIEELLAGERAEEWPAYHAMLGLRGFADQVRQFLLRAQEALLAPDDVAARAAAAGLSGWPELARFYRRYLDVLGDMGMVDWAGLVEQAAAGAAEGEPLFDHVMVDDYQEATFATERLIVDLDAGSLVVAGDPDAHVFSFQGTTDVPIRRFVDALPTARRVELLTEHRAPAASLEAWYTPYPSEEHAAVARELRRVHVEEGVPWGDLAVVVRRQAPGLGSLLRALDDAAIPRTVPERGLSLRAEPATVPFVLAMRWLGDREARDGLVEALLTSDLAGLSPAAARGLIRAAQVAGGRRSEALARREGLERGEAEAVATLQDVLERAEAASRSAADSFRVLWAGLPFARRLVAAGGSSPEAERDLDAVVAFADALSQLAGRPDASVSAFLDMLEGTPGGPGLWRSGGGDRDAVRVHTAHGTAGQEFDTVIVTGVVEGDFPSLARSEPMFDLAVLDHPVAQSERNRRRLEDERRLFRLVTGRARRRVVLTASEPQREGSTLSARSRFVQEAELSWVPAPAPPFPEPLTLGEAEANWRRRLADPSAPAPSRVAALTGILALGSDPRRWWFQRHWTESDAPLHDHMRVSHSRLDKLDNCALQFVLGQELGLEGESGYQAWVGTLVHRLIEDCENGVVPRSFEALVEEAERRWQAERFPSHAVSEAFRALVTRSILPAWFREFGQAPAALARERRFEFEFAGATVTGVIDRIGPCDGGGTQITDYKTGKARNATKAPENLQLGIYYLAVNRDPELRDYRPVRAVDLAFLRDVDRSGQIDRTVKAFLGKEDEAAFSESMSERLGELIERLQELQERPDYAPNPAANCRFCDFKPLCPLWPEGRDVFPLQQVGVPP